MTAEEALAVEVEFLREQRARVATILTRCPVCRTSGTDPHVPGSADCQAVAAERAEAHTD